MATKVLRRKHYHYALFYDYITKYSEFEFQQVHTFSYWTLPQSLKYICNNIPCNTALFCTWNIWIHGSSTSGQNNITCCDNFLISWLIGQLDSVLVHKRSIFVVVFNIFLTKLHLVSPVQTSNMILDVLDHRFPVVCIFLWCVPTVSSGVIEWFTLKYK